MGGTHSGFPIRLRSLVGLYRNVLQPCADGDALERESKLGATRNTVLDGSQRLLSKLLQLSPTRGGAPFTENEEE